MKIWDSVYIYHQVFILSFKIIFFRSTILTKGNPNTRISETFKNWTFPFSDTLVFTRLRSKYRTFCLVFVGNSEFHPSLATILCNHLAKATKPSTTYPLPNLYEAFNKTVINMCNPIEFILLKF